MLNDVSWSFIVSCSFTLIPQYFQKSPEKHFGGACPQTPEDAFAAKLETDICQRAKKSDSLDTMKNPYIYIYIITLVSTFPQI